MVLMAPEADAVLGMLSVPSIPTADRLSAGSALVLHCGAPWCSTGTHDRHFLSAAAHVAEGLRQQTCQPT
jgi:hypothetical protein